MNKLVVKFYSINNNALIGYGYYMPSIEYFKNTYMPEHFPEYKKIDNNKYKRFKNDNCYISCEYEN